MKFNVVESVLKANDAVARENRKQFDQAGVLALNLMSAPGSGKTALLEKTLPALREKAAVLVGDLQTTRDAERLSAVATETTQINTGTGCHLTATQVAEALGGLKLPGNGIGYLFIENVGNMVCPAAFELGEHLKVVLLSVPEGDDKVAKYPTLFQPADVILLTKQDLAAMLDWNRDRVYEDISRVNTRADVLEISSRTGQGMDRWLEWLRRRRQQFCADRALRP